MIRPNRFGGFGSEGFGASLGAVPADVTIENFDEAFYREQNPDVAEFIRTVNPNWSGWGHFNSSGYAEGRPWRKIGGTYQAQPDPQILVHLDEARAAVRAMYQRYLHRAGSQVDQEGMDFWANVIINDGAAGLAHAEQGFRTSAVNDGIYTQATLPAPQYFTITPTNNGGAGNGGNDDEGDDGTSVADTTVPTTDGDGGVLGGVVDTIGGFFDSIAESTGIQKNYLEIGAVAAGLGLLIYMNSSSGTRKR